MNSPNWIRLPLLDNENPQNGFHHFAKLQRDFESVEAYLKDNKAMTVPGYLFHTLARSYKELGTKIDLSKATDSDGKNEPGKIQDQHPKASWNKFIPLSSRDSSMIYQTSVRLNSDILTAKHLDRPNDRTYTVLITNYETNEPNLGDLSFAFESAARFIFNENATRLSYLKNVEDIKNIRWSSLSVSDKEKCPLLIDFRTPQIANEVIARGLYMSNRLHCCSIYDKLCSNCYAYGHSVKICFRPTRCGRCAKNHPTRYCKSTLCTCAICGSGHASTQCNTLVEIRRPGTYSGAQKRLWPFESDPKIEETETKPSPSVDPPLKNEGTEAKPSPSVDTPLENEFTFKRMMTRSQTAEAKRMMARSNSAEATFYHIKEEPLSNR